VRNNMIREKCKVPQPMVEAQKKVFLKRERERETSFSKEVSLSQRATRPYPRIAALYFSAQTFWTFSMAFCTSSLVRVRSGARKVREKAMDLLPSPI